MSFANKVAIVTGASSGIGAAIAVLFAKEGANVVMIGRNETKLKIVEESCISVGKKPLVIKADVGNDEEVKKIITETVEKFGQIDILVNNAGFAECGGVLDGKVLEAYDVTFKINVRAVIHLTMLAAPYLIRTKGNIVNISSVAAYQTPKHAQMIPYAISKAALDHFTRGAALELSSSGVRVNSVNPGPVRTDFLDNAGIDAKWDDMQLILPLKRVSDPEEIADLVLYLAGEKAKGITGSIFVSDNGYLLNNDSK